MDIQSSGFILRYRNTGIEFYLVLKNKWDHNWSFPKGHVEKNESPFLAAVRELKEETGITTDDFILENLSYVDCVQKLKKSTKKCPNSIKKVRFFFGYLPKQPKITLSREHVNFRYCTLGSLSRLLDDCFLDILKDRDRQLEMERLTWIYEKNA